MSCTCCLMLLLFRLILVVLIGVLSSSRVIGASSRGSAPGCSVEMV